MKVIFWGTPAFALPTLEALIEAGHEVRAVVTAPDRPQGRGRKLLPSPVKAWAQRHHLPVLQPRTPAGEDFLATLRTFDPEIQVVVAYGKILRPEVLALAPRGALNVHASLLPRYRGAAPIQHAILAGELETGVTVFQMDEGMDTGPILLQKRAPIGAEETTGELAERLARLGARALVETLRGLEVGRLMPQPQDSHQVSYAPKIKKEEPVLRWEKPAERLAREVRAFNPEPGSFTYRQGVRLKVLRARASRAPNPGNPGEVVAVSPVAIEVATGAGRLIITELQPAGRRAMSAAEYLWGYRVQVGERWGE